MVDHIAFFRKSAWPSANAVTVRLLGGIFPNAEIEIIDIATLVESKRSVMALNTLHTLRMYGIDILLKRKSFRESFWRTPYLHHIARSMITQAAPARRFRFSFQMQSLFNAAQPELPNFIYTDHTHLANLYYPGYDTRQQFAPEWVALERSTYQSAARIFTRSAHISRSLVEQYGCDPAVIQCVYSGSSADWNRAMTVNTVKYASKTILFVGVDWKVKGGPDLLAAFEKVLKVVPDARLVIVGCLPKISTPNVTVVGWVPPEQVHAYYEQAAVFCLPTTLEPYGLPLIEALSHKLPVVATHIGANPDIITSGEMGYLIEPHAIDELAGALIKIINAPEMAKEFGEQGYQQAQDRFNWQQVGLRLRDGILEALGRPALDSMLPQKRQTGSLSPDRMPRKITTGNLSGGTGTTGGLPSDRLDQRKPVTGNLSPDRLPRKVNTGNLSPDRLPRKTNTGSLPPDRLPPDKPRTGPLS